MDFGLVLIYMTQSPEKESNEDDDDGGFWKALKAHKKQKFFEDRQKFLNEALDKEWKIEWRRHTGYHWSVMVHGQQLDYWPSRKKFRYMGVTRRGDVEKYHKHITENAPKTGPKRAGTPARNHSKGTPSSSAVGDRLPKE